MIQTSVQSSGWPTQKDFDDLIEYGAKELSRRIYDFSVRLSPVRTGSFRASWRVAFNTPDYSITNSLATASTIGAPGFVWPSGFRPGDTVIISNAQPYAQALDEGHSRQAPLGITRIAVVAAKML